MNGRSFDVLTDWIGIPLTVLLILVLVVIDVRSVRVGSVPRPLLWSGGLLLIATITIVVARFVRLA